MRKIPVGGVRGGVRRDGGARLLPDLLEQLVLAALDALLQPGAALLSGLLHLPGAVLRVQNGAPCRRLL